MEIEMDGDGRVKWNSKETAPKDGTEVLLLTAIGIVNAWFHDEPGEVGGDDGKYEWVCYDDAFTIDGDGMETIKGWLPIEVFGI